MRILLSEGGSTSAREAITALALNGHRVEVCDPDPRCLGRFSSLVSRFHRCPGLGKDPEGYLRFILDQVAGGRFDVLLPIHEQGFLFARVAERIRRHVGLALPSFDSYAQVHGKISFSRLLSDLGLPQPATKIVVSLAELKAAGPPPFVLKAAIGTASRGTWMIRTPADLDGAIESLQASGGIGDGVLVQELAAGPLEHAQAVYAAGRLVGFHAYRQVMRGAGGGDAVKESIRRPDVRTHLARLGERLSWHGALTVDYILDERSQSPLYIDGNPRLVEPMGAFIAGIDLADLLVRISSGEDVAPVAEAPEGILTHLAIQALLGHAIAGGTRMSLLRECWRLAAKRGPYAGSREELTPVRLDMPSAIPVAVAALWLLANPGAARYLPQRGWGSHLLTPESVRKIGALTE